jgi:exonuclease I
MPTHACVADVLQVLNYDDFVRKPLSKKPAHMSTFNSSDHSNNVSDNCTSICDDKLDYVAPIAILNTNLTGIGPQQCEILQVQTSRFTIQTSISTHQLYCLWSQTFTFL